MRRKISEAMQVCESRSNSIHRTRWRRGEGQGCQIQEQVVSHYRVWDEGGHTLHGMGGGQGEY